MPPRTLEEQIGGRCKHYTGTGRSETCGAGVNYEQLGDGSRPGMLNRLPCLRTHLHEDVIATCERLEWHTPEEVAAQVKELRDMGLKSITARNAITEHLKASGKPLRNVSGSIPCPVCDKGNLGFGIAYNGHCHATCSTKGCVSWME
jgi:hypothetical protein